MMGLNREKSLNLQFNYALNTDATRRVPTEEQNMIVCIAEKPSVAREIANVLGANHTHQGYIEGNGYQVTWTFGHLCELKEPHEYNERWKRWDVYDLPIIPPRCRSSSLSSSN